MPRIPKARAWSNTVRRYQFRASDVDLYVLRDQDEILHAMGRARRPDQPSAVERVAAAFLPVAVIVPFFSVAAFGGPIPGNNAVSVDAMTGNGAVSYLAVCFLLALPGPALVAHRWWRSHRRRDVLELSYLLATAVLGVLALRAMTTEGAGPLSLPIVPVWATVATAAAVLAAQALASRGRRTLADRDFRVVGPPDPDRVGELVEALPRRVGEQLLDMRTRAVARLIERGVINRAQADRVAARPLGTC